MDDKQKEGIILGASYFICLLPVMNQFFRCSIIQDLKSLIKTLALFFLSFQTSELLMGCCIAEDQLTQSSNTFNSHREVISELVIFLRFRKSIERSVKR